MDQRVYVFRHETIDGHQAITLFRAFLKDVCESRDNIGFCEYRLPDFNSPGYRNADLSNLTGTWKVMVSMRDEFRFHSTEPPPLAAATG
jgi:hypothetical protein